jgi:hypothetical protein
VINFATADANQSFDDWIFAILSRKEIALRMWVRDDNSIRVIAEGKSSPDAAARRAEISPFRRDDESELFRPDKVQGSGHAIKVPFRNSVVLSIIAGVSIEPKRTARVFDCPLEVLPSDGTLLQPVRISVDQMIFLLVAMRLVAFHLDRDDVQ